MRWNEILTEATRWTNLYWFWFSPGRNRLVHVDGTHSSAALDMGFARDDGDAPDIEDDEIIAKAIAAGWVRGRFGSRSGDDGEHEWTAPYNSPRRGASYELSLQGKRDTVLETARMISKRRRISDLYLDFESGAAMESIHLSGGTMENYLDGRLLTIGESFVDTLVPQYGKRQPFNVFRNPTTKEWREIFGNNGNARIYVVDDDIVAWNTFGELHRNVKEELKLGQNAIPAVIYGKPRQDCDVQVSDATKNTPWWHNGDVIDVIQNCDYLQKTFKNIEVSFYDEDIVGRWDELED